MTSFEVLLALGPDRTEALFQKVYEQYGQGFRAVGLRKMQDQYSVDIVLVNGEKRTVSV